MSHEHARLVRSAERRLRRTFSGLRPLTVVTSPSSPRSMIIFAICV